MKSGWCIKNIEDENYLISKESDYSMFNGKTMHVAKNAYEKLFSIFDNCNPPVEFGENVKIYFLLGEKIEEINLKYLGRRDRKTSQYTLSYSNDFAELLKQKFKVSYKYISEHKEGVKQVYVPNELREYIDFYRTNEPNTYRVELNSCSNSLNNIEHYLKDKPQIVREFFKYICNKGKLGQAYKMSYKAVLLIAFLKLQEEQKKEKILYKKVCESMLEIYKNKRINKGLPIEQNGSELITKGIDMKYVKPLMKAKPIRAFNNNGFMEIEKTDGSEYLKFNSKLYNVLTDEDREKLLELLWNKFYQYYAEKVDINNYDESVFEENELQTETDNEIAAVIEEPLVNIEDYNEALDFIYDYIKNNGFTYDKKQIRNLFLSLKSKPFSILSGISGTGKSKVIELFAEAIGATRENGRFILIPVKPDWSDSSELIGYRNLQGKFIPGELTNIIHRAINDKDRPYFICIDEMNLARVEYYFSDVLSLMESRKEVDGEFKTDRILKDESFGEDDDSTEKYGNLYIPENIYIIGTVNMDETTFPFSRKVLDRAFTIEFNHVDLEFDFDFQEKDIESRNIHNDFLKSSFNKLINCKDYKDTANDIIKTLGDINNILYDSGDGFAYRVRDEIVFYCLYAFGGALGEQNILEAEESLDLCLKQKILPRLQGNSSDILKNLMDIYSYVNEGFNIEINGEYIDQKQLDSIKENNKDSHYPETSNKIYSMIRRYIRDGFTTFWE